MAAEAASLDKAEDYGNFVAATLSELADGKHVASMQAPAFEVVPVTDARSLWDAVHRLSANFQEKRVEISVASLREQLVPQSSMGTDRVPACGRADQASSSPERLL